MHTSAVRRARLVLVRLSPPFRRVVTVHPVTVGGWMLLVREVIARVAQLRIAKLPGVIDGGEIARIFTERELALFADLVCEEQRPGFLGAWLGPDWAPHGLAQLTGRLARRNIEALREASRAAEGEGGWTRIFGTLKLGPRPETERPGKGSPAAGGALMGNVHVVAKVFGIDPAAVLDWPMQLFLDQIDLLVAGYQAARTAESPLHGENEDLEPSPLSDFAGFGSGRVVH